MTAKAQVFDVLFELADFAVETGDAELQASVALGHKTALREAFGIELNAANTDEGCDCREEANCAHHSNRSVH